MSTFSFSREIRRLTLINRLLCRLMQLQVGRAFKDGYDNGIQDATCELLK